MLDLTDKIEPREPAFGGRKVASGDFLVNPNKHTYRLSAAAQELCRVKSSTATISASGRSMWPNRDPIGELGTYESLQFESEKLDLEYQLLSSTDLLVHLKLLDMYKQILRKRDYYRELAAKEPYLFVKNAPTNSIDYLGNWAWAAAAWVAADRVLSPIVGCLCGVTTDMMFDSNFSMCNTWKNGGSFSDGLEAAVGVLENYKGREALED
ncbi:MAG: hypothetical protein AAF226_13360, partial [Verrucomicrobiota bacterium]